MKAGNEAIFMNDFNCLNYFILIRKDKNYEIRIL